MRNFGRAIAAFTIIWAATATSFAQTRAEAPAAGAPAVKAATDEPGAGHPAAGDSAAVNSAAEDPTAEDPAAGDPVTSDSATDTEAAVAVAPMLVTQVTVASATDATPSVPPRPAAHVAPGPAPMVAVPQAVYVTDFVAVPAGAPPSGLLARLRAALHAHAAGREAGLVAQAVVQRLSHAGVAARYLAPGEPPPVQGWLIGGVFHVPGEPGALSDGAASGTEAPGADVSVTVADLEHGADTPFALIGVPPATSDEAGKWHPYVLPAKLSLERTDRNSAIAALAQQIADSFVGNMTALRQADARAISP
jgi:hypothetical protein